MEIFLSAVLGELASRSMSFIINRYSKPPERDVEDCLQKILLRTQVIVEEAAGRHITNQGMLRQLSMLRDATYRGYYVLDAFRYRAHEEGKAKDEHVSQSSVLSKFNYANRICFSSSSTRSLEELQEVLNSLNTMVLDVNELVVFLKSYPRLYRQPYSMHLLLGKSMFGRQMEMELVINFLLHIQPHGASKFDVLPIVGPGRVGKSTLVSHVCNDERVRDHFSQIVFLREDDIRGEKLATLRDRCAMAHQDCGIKENERLLVVVEVDGDLDEDAWEMLCYASKRCVTSGGKIIITSRSDKIKKLGTVQPLTLKPLSKEAYWYFFKMITFGSTDPELHPKHAYLSMEIARVLKGHLPAANVPACVLRENFDIHFWRKVLSFLRGFIEKHHSMFGEHPCDPLYRNKPTYLQRMAIKTEYFFVQYQTCSSQEEVPKIKFQDLMFGSIKPHGTFSILEWKSHIPPYHCYIYTCEIRQLQTKVVKRKRCLDSSLG